MREESLSTSKPKSRKHSAGINQSKGLERMRSITIEPVVLIFFFSYVLLLPLLQQYIYDELSSKYNFTKGKQEELCENGTEAGHNVTSLESQVQTEASHWFVALSLCSK